MDTRMLPRMQLPPALASPLRLTRGQQSSYKHSPNCRFWESIPVNLWKSALSYYTRCDRIERLTLVSVKSIKDCNVLGEYRRHLEMGCKYRTIQEKGFVVVRAL